MIEWVRPAKNSIENGASDIELDDEVEALLELFPQENRERLVARIAHLSLEEQVAVLQYSRKKRVETLTAPRYTSENLQIIGRISEGVFVRAFDSARQSTDVGQGENGRVFEYEGMDGDQKTVVYKMLIRAPMHYQNDLLSEGAYQADVAKFADGQMDLRVRVPHPYYIAATVKGYVLAMEKIPGHSDTEPMAYIIDFGLCTRAYSQDEAYRTIDGLRDNVIIKKVIERLRNHQARLHSEAS